VRRRRKPDLAGHPGPAGGYGADIVCGDIQPLGMHMQFGGGQAGFIATATIPKYLLEYPSRLFGIAPPRCRASTALATWPMSAPPSPS